MTRLFVTPAKVGVQKTAFWAAEKENPYGRTPACAGMTGHER